LSVPGAARPINIVAALVITVLEVALFVAGLRPVPTPGETPARVTVRLVEWPQPSPAPPAEALPMIETAPPVAQEIASAPEPPPPAPMPALESAKPTPLRPAKSSRRSAARSSQAPPAMRSPPPSPALSPPIEYAAPGGGTMGARAIYRPMPEIPEDLRRRNLRMVAIARFRVAADGGAEVELTQPTSDPRLNVAVLAALRKWRFFPAMIDGRPAASTIDVRIPIAVD
jgi:periplasmic protein TonB